jgi:hypothetical protein
VGEPWLPQARTEAAGLEPANGVTRLRRSRALPYHSAMPPKDVRVPGVLLAGDAPSAGRRGTVGTAAGVARSGRRGSRTPKTRRPTRFRDGVPHRWQSFQWPRQGSNLHVPG